MEKRNRYTSEFKAKLGYRTTNNLITMCYIIAGKLDFGATYYGMYVCPQ
jgi:hypothetical protein